ncbi:hypothetical protein HC928_15195, partial [bacterium]|nr:hypothetical protein [bacterium]
MSIWILTIGNSDVQLKSENHNWTKLFRGDARKQADGLGFIPEKSRLENYYTVEARVMGLTYSQPKAKEFVGDLCFPLIDNFFSKLKDKSVERIILILSDQQDVFTSSDRRWKNCPYWQDTCELQPVLENYLKSKDCFANASIDEPIILKPSSPTDGLDNWDKTLELVRSEFSKKFPHELPEDEIVYVSHQAGTPAISSAVQFVSLAKFGKLTEFLVSSEQQTRPPEILPSSAYLKGIRFQEAKALLKRHDYSGVRDILGLTGKKPDLPEEKRIKYLLDAGELWNFAEFQKFKKILTDRKLLPIDSFPWCQSGYESIY